MPDNIIDLKIDLDKIKCPVIGIKWDGRVVTRFTILVKLFDTSICHDVSITSDTINVGDDYYINRIYDSPEYNEAKMKLMNVIIEELKRNEWVILVR